MGGQNVLAGKVEKVTGAVAVIAAPDGILYDLIDASGLVVGAPVKFSVRRDRIALSDAGTAVRNAAHGRIVNIEYQGTFVKVSLDAGRGEEFIVYVDDDEYLAAPKEVGQVVYATWKPELNHLLRGTNGSAGTPHE